MLRHESGKNLYTYKRAKKNLKKKFGPVFRVRIFVANGPPRVEISTKVCFSSRF